MRSLSIIAMILLSPSLMAQEADAPEPEDELLEGVAEGDEADETIEEFLEELREEAQVRREETRVRREESETPPRDEPQAVLVPPCGLDSIVTAIRDGVLMGSCSMESSEQ